MASLRDLSIGTGHEDDAGKAHRPIQASRSEAEVTIMLSDYGIYCITFEASTSWDSCYKDVKSTSLVNRSESAKG